MPKKTESSGRVKRIAAFAALVVLIAGAGTGAVKIWQLLLYSNPRLALRRVEVRTFSGGYWETRHEMLKQSIGLVNGRNVFGYSLKKLREDALKHRNLADVEVELVLPDAIRLTLSERIPCALLDGRDAPYAADCTGTILKTNATMASKLNLPVIVESRRIDYRPHYIARKPRKELLPALILCTIVQEHFPNLKLQEVHLTPGNALEARLSYFNQPVCYVLFRGDGSRAQYIFYLERFLDAINDARRHGDMRNHFDLRFDGRINVY